MGTGLVNYIMLVRYVRNNNTRLNIRKSVRAAPSPVCPLLDVGHVVLEQPEVGPVSPLQPPHLVAAQLAYKLLQPPVTGAARGGVHGPGPAHQPAQPRHGQHQVLLRPGLQVHDVGEVRDAGRAVLGVASPVGILSM